MADNILSCDWGTTSFRLRLVRVSDGEVIAKTSAGQGISAVYEEWLAAGLPESERQSFYRSKLLAAIRAINHTGVLRSPVFISGMASSSIGMQLLDYGDLPFDLQSVKLPHVKIPATTDFPHDILLVSGLKTNRDVMRGEETILAGFDAGTVHDFIVIFPGTHSKHAFVKDNVLVDFATFMTGEFFDLLAHKSILSKSVLRHDEILAREFSEGVLEGATGNLLNAAFHVRTRQLLQAKLPAGNFDFLSGLLIGQELGSLTSSTGIIFLVSGQALTERYKLAAEVLGLGDRLKIADADTALVKAHCLLQKMK